MPHMDGSHDECRTFAEQRAARIAPGAATDASGFAVFSDGDVGGAHVVAHDLLDAGRHQEGRRLLGSFLDGQSGTGSDWLHLQWHLAVFEIETGCSGQPLERFRNHILPEIKYGEALTDAPSLLWRLALAGAPLRDRDVRPARDVALEDLATQEDPYVEVHNLLALGAAGDVPSLDGWLDAKNTPDHMPCYQVVRLIARGLRSFATGDYRSASRSLRLGARAIPWLGGSAGQNELFEQLWDEAYRRGGPKAVPVEQVILAASA